MADDGVIIEWISERRFFDEDNYGAGPRARRSLCCIPSWLCQGGATGSVIFIFCGSRGRSANGGAGKTCGLLVRSAGTGWPSGRWAATPRRIWEPHPEQKVPDRGGRALVIFPFDGEVDAFSTVLNNR